MDKKLVGFGGVTALISAYSLIQEAGMTFLPYLPPLILSGVLLVVGIAGVVKGVKSY